MIRNRRAASRHDGQRRRDHMREAMRRRVVRMLSKLVRQQRSQSMGTSERWMSSQCVREIAEPFALRAVRVRGQLPSPGIKIGPGDQGSRSIQIDDMSRTMSQHLSRFQDLQRGDTTSQLRTTTVREVLVARHGAVLVVGYYAKLGA